MQRLEVSGALGVKELMKLEVTFMFIPCIVNNSVYYTPTYAQKRGVNVYYNYSDMFRC